MAKISVIVPVYNAEQWLERCVDSIVAQTYTDWELLLIDDGSTDRSGDICDRYAASDPRIQALHKPNGGVSSARNLGLDHAQGEWITFVDSDDYIEVRFLESMTDNLDADLIIGNAIELNNKNISYDITPSWGYKIYDVNSFFSEFFGYLILRTPWSKLYRKDIIKTRFPEDVNNGEDTIFVLKYIQEIQSIRVFKYDNHINCSYVYQSSEEYTKKYSFSVNEATYSLTKVWHCYINSTFQNTDFESFIINHYYSLCHNDLENNYTDWYSNQIVKSIKYKIAKRYGIICFIKAILIHFIYSYKLKKWIK